MFRKVLVANRGEIAIRVFRTLRELGIGSVGVYSEVDRDAPFVAYADEAYLIGPGPAAESYLKYEVIIETALRAGAQAIHPGYGFLAENAPFARACAEAGLVFIGPSPEAIDAMGSKIQARAMMDAAGVPIVPGVTEPVDTVEDARGIAAQIGYPIAVKAAAGGGGKGFRVALTADDLADAFEGARREAEKFFADTVVYLERYLPNPRHVEIQIMADTHGNCVWLGERDCSVQRRHQKLVEETPSPVVSDELRVRMGEASVRAARAVDYVSAGTLEYLVSGEEFFFPGDEHPHPGRAHDHRDGRRHRPGARADCASRPASGCRSPRRTSPLGARVRVPHQRRGCHQALPALAGPDHRLPRADRARHAGRLRRARGDADRRDLRSDGRQTDRLGRRPRDGAASHVARPRRVCRRRAGDADPLPQVAVRVGRVHRRRGLPRRAGASGRCADPAAGLGARTARRGAAAAAASEPQVVREFVAEVDGRRFGVRLQLPASQAGAAVAAPAPRAARRGTHASGSGKAGQPREAVTTPMQGTVLRVLVAEGQEVAEGDVICIVEAMKMENEVAAHRAGVVKQLSVAEGQSVDADQVIATVD